MQVKIEGKSIGVVVVGILISAIILGSIYFLARTFVYDIAFYNGLGVGQQIGIQATNQQLQQAVNNGQIIIPEQPEIAPTQ